MTVPAYGECVAEKHPCLFDRGCKRCSRQKELQLQWSTLFDKQQRGNTHRQHQFRVHRHTLTHTHLTTLHSHTQAMDAWSEAVASQQAQAAATTRAQAWHTRRRLCVCMAALQEHVYTAGVLRHKVAAIILRTSSGVCG